MDRPVLQKREGQFLLLDTTKTIAAIKINRLLLFCIESIIEVKSTPVATLKLFGLSKYLIIRATKITTFEFKSDCPSIVVSHWIKLGLHETESRSTETNQDREELGDLKIKVFARYIQAIDEMIRRVKILTELLGKRANKSGVGHPRIELPERENNEKSKNF